MHKPSILFIADYPNWAFHNIYRSISLRLGVFFSFDIYFTSLKKQRRNSVKLEKQYDLVWLCYPMDKSYLKLKFKPKHLVKEVASWRWAENFTNTEDFVSSELKDADFIACPSLQLYKELSKYSTKVLYMPNGVESWFFKNKLSKNIVNSKSPVIGWVGNTKDTQKNYWEVENLIQKGFSIKVAQNLNLFQLRKFYRSIDILLITSKTESQPLPFLEALSAGCYVISRPVGIVEEILNGAEDDIGKIVDFEINLYDVLNSLNVKPNSLKRLDIVQKNDWDNIAGLFNYFFYILLSNKTIASSSFNNRYLYFERQYSPIYLNKFLYLAILCLDYFRYGLRKF